MRLLLPLDGERTEQHIQSRVAVRFIPPSPIRHRARPRQGPGISPMVVSGHSLVRSTLAYPVPKRQATPLAQASGYPARRLGSRPAGRRRRQPSQDTALAATIGHKQVGDKHHHYHREDEREVDVLDGYAQHI